MNGDVLPHLRELADKLAAQRVALEKELTPDLTVLKEIDRLQRRAEFLASLDPQQECPECGKLAQPYRDDYICYSCRDKLEAL